jgi:hypothetical protein
VLIELKREMGPIAFSAQYQQTPIPPGGTIIEKRLTTYDEIASRPDDRIVISWDIALSEIESGDYSACVVLLIRKEIAYILEVAWPLSVRNAEAKGHGAQAEVQSFHASDRRFSHQPWSHSKPARAIRQRHDL